MVVEENAFATSKSIAMLIGEIAEKSDLSRHTIRFYEKLGLIQVPRKSRRENNYKEYPEDTLARLQAIKQLKAIGFTLKETKSIIHLTELGMLDPERGKNYIYKKIKLIQQKIETLTTIKNKLMQVAEACGSEGCEVNKILESYKQSSEAETQEHPEVLH